MKANNKILNKIIIVLIVGILVTIIDSFMDYNLMSLPKLDSNIISQFSLIIITNSIFAGVSFTTLGILISLSSADLIKKLSNTTVMLHKNYVLITCIAFCCLSISLSLIFVLRLDRTIINSLYLILLKGDLYYKLYPKFINFIYVVSLLSFLNGFIYFIKSIKEVSNLLIKVYTSNTPKITNIDVQLFKKRLKELEKENKNLENEI